MTPPPHLTSSPPLSVYICLHLPAAPRRAVVLWMRQDVAEEDDGANTPSPLSSFSGSQMEACPPKSAYTPRPPYPASLPVLVHAPRAMLSFGAEVAVAVSSPTVAVLVEKNGWVGGHRSGVSITPGSKCFCQQGLKNVWGWNVGVTEMPSVTMRTLFLRLSPLHCSNCHKRVPNRIQNCLLQSQNVQIMSGCIMGNGGSNIFWNCPCKLRQLRVGELNLLLLCCFQPRVMVCICRKM